MPVTEELLATAASSLGVEVVRALKPGGQKTVLLAKRGDTDLVLKVIATGSLPDSLRRARREVELLQRVSHPNVVPVASDLVELGDGPDGAAWLEPFLPGDDLSELLDERWSWAEAREMALDVARGLGALHETHVVHRDLSANNVRKVRDGPFVVMDPGYARHADRSQVTVGGQPGTPGFLSPEHVQGYSGAPTPASDVFGVGILAFLVLAGDLPIPLASDLGAYVGRLSRSEVTDIRSVREDLPPQAVALIRRCLHAQPARRFLTGGQLAAALEVVVA